MSGIPGTYKNGKATPGGILLPDATEPCPYFGTVGVISGERASYTEFWVTLMRNVSVMGELVATKVTMSVDVCGNLNTICRSSRERRDDWVWIMGDDHVWQPDLLPRLIEHDVDIVVPNCLKRNPPWQSVVYSRQDQDGFYVMAQQDGLLPEDGLVEVHAAGSAGMLIRGYVLDEIGDPYFRPDPHGVGLNEDVYFCQRARDAGFRIFCDSGALLGHISKYAVWPEFRDGEWQATMEFDQKRFPLDRVFPREEVTA